MKTVPPIEHAYEILKQLSRAALPHHCDSAEAQKRAGAAADLVDTLYDAIAEARADGERLDWLESVTPTWDDDVDGAFDYLHADDPTESGWVRRPGGERYASLRDAVDAARDAVSPRSGVRDKSDG